jgi:hypothetical protein
MLEESRTALGAAATQHRSERGTAATQKDEPFKGTEVSRKSVAALVADIVTHPDRWVRANLGVDKPGTDGEKPAFARTHPPPGGPTCTWPR